MCWFSMCAVQHLSLFWFYCWAFACDCWFTSMFPSVCYQFSVILLLAWNPLLIICQNLFFTLHSSDESLNLKRFEFCHQVEKSHVHQTFRPSVKLIVIVFESLLIAHHKGFTFKSFIFLYVWRLAYCFSMIALQHAPLSNHYQVLALHCFDIVHTHWVFLCLAFAFRSTMQLSFHIFYFLFSFFENKKKLFTKK